MGKITKTGRIMTSFRDSLSISRSSVTFNYSKYLGVSFACRQLHAAGRVGKVSTPRRSRANISVASGLHVIPSFRNSADTPSKLWGPIFGVRLFQFSTVSVFESSSKAAALPFSDNDRAVENARVWLSYCGGDAARHCWPRKRIVASTRNDHSICNLFCETVCNDDKKRGEPKWKSYIK